MGPFVLLHAWAAYRLGWEDAGEVGQVTVIVNFEKL